MGMRRRSASRRSRSLGIALLAVVLGGLALSPAAAFRDDQGATPILTSASAEDPLLMGGEVTLNDGTPATTIVGNQSHSDYPSLIVRLVSSVELFEDGEVLLSLALNGTTALQTTVTRSGNRMEARHLTIVSGWRRDKASGSALQLDQMNFAQSGASSQGRTLVTFRAQSTGRAPIPRFEWQIDERSTLVATHAQAEELDLAIAHDRIRQSLGGDVLVPIKVTRRGYWETGPLQVEVTSDTSKASGRATLAGSESELVVRIEGDSLAERPETLTARVDGAFNEPRDFTVIRVLERDGTEMLLGTLLMVGGSLAVAIILLRGRRRLVWPVIAIVLGAALAGRAVFLAPGVAVEKPTYQDVTEVSGSEPTPPRVLSSSEASRFDSAVEDSDWATYLETCRGVLTEEIPGGRAVRVYELFPREADGSVCKVTGRKLLGTPSGSQRENERDGLVNIELAPSGSLVGRWGYPADREG